MSATGMAKICLKKDEAANLTVFPPPPHSNTVASEPSWPVEFGYCDDITRLDCRGPTALAIVQTEDIGNRCAKTWVTLSLSDNGGKEMPWRKSTVSEKRAEFILLASKEGCNVSALCQRFGISRKTGYKWLRTCSLSPGMAVNRSRNQRNREYQNEFPAFQNVFRPL
jgi:hypothetical protein